MKNIYKLHSTLLENESNVRKVISNHRFLGNLDKAEAIEAQIREAVKMANYNRTSGYVSPSATPTSEQWIEIKTGSLTPARAIQINKRNNMITRETELKALFGYGDGSERTERPCLKVQTAIAQAKWNRRNNR